MGLITARAGYIVGSSDSECAELFTWNRPAYDKESQVADRQRTHRMILH